MKEQIKWFVGLAVVVLTITFPSVNGGLLNYDDERYITQNPWLSHSEQEPEGSLWTSYFDGHYHPLTLLSLKVDESLGSDPIQAHHRTNWLLHAMNAMVLFWLLSLLLKNKPLAVGIAAIWAIHPVAVESYAWMTERKNVLYALFFLLSAVQYVKYLRTSEVKHYSLTLLFFLLSCFAKGQGILLLPVFFLLDYLESDKLIDTSKLTLKIAPLVIALIFVYLGREAQNEAWDLSDTPYALGDRVFMGSYAFISYILHSLAPVNLIPYYPYPVDVNEEIGTIHYASLAGVLAYLGLVVYAYLKKKKWFFFGLAWFFVNIALMLKVLEVPYGNYIMADRYAYLPMIGLLIPMLQLVWTYTERQFKAKNATWVVMGGLILVLSFFTRQNIEHWSSSTALWGEVVDRYPNYLNGWNMYGLGALAEGNPSEAIQAFEKMMTMDESSAEAPVNLAMLYEQMNNKVESQRYIQIALERSPDELPILEKASILALRQNRNQEALDFTEKAVRLYPEEAEVAVLRAQALTKVGRVDNAIEVLTAFPSHAAAQNLKQQLLQLQSQPDPSIETARQYMSGGIQQIRNGNPDEGLRLLNLAQQTAPEYYAVYSNRGSFYAQNGQFDLAEKDYLKALQLAPQNGSVASMMGTLYNDMGDKSKACTYFLKAAQLGERIPKEVLANCP